MNLPDQIGLQVELRGVDFDTHHLPAQPLSVQQNTPFILTVLVDRDRETVERLITGRALVE